MTGLHLLELWYPRISMKKKALLNDGDTSIKRLYIDQLAQAPGLMRLLDKAELTSEVRSTADYSYSADHHAGPGYRIVGDAGGMYNCQGTDTIEEVLKICEAFIDPLFSTGVHLAFNGSLSAASTIAASIRGDCTEEQAAEFHNTKVEVSYTRYEDTNFLITVLAIYKQIRAQKENVLADIDEDNFDRLFHLLRPVVLGTVDIDPGLSPREIEEPLDFLNHIVWPTQPQSTDEVFKHAVLEVTKKKALHVIRGHSHYHNDVIQGYRANLVRGKLGLRKV
ncbi:hypothetical protein C0993_004534 [Termitomyces sp. T159_Od127]|nr:hypothetical protein C0993_004534 [Termitomyces sp. T159_Od127]